MEGLKTCMRYIFILSILILLGIFITDWFFTRNKDLLNDTIVGVMLGSPIGWFGAFVAFYTTEKISEMKNKKTEVENGNQNPSQGTDN